MDYFPDESSLRETVDSVAHSHGFKFDSDLEVTFGKTWLYSKGNVRVIVFYKRANWYRDKWCSVAVPKRTSLPINIQKVASDLVYQHLHKGYVKKRGSIESWLEREFSPPALA